MKLSARERLEARGAAMRAAETPPRPPPPTGTQDDPRAALALCQTMLGAVLVEDWRPSPDGTKMRDHVSGEVRANA